ncbi:hypothetical protein J7K44_02310 [bacterium]|nr:hypothetical protein [bacterium]
MKTKIIILLIILVLIGIGGVVFLLLRKEKLPEIVSFSDLEVPSVSLPSDVEIGELNLDELNIGISLPSDLFSNVSVDSNIGKYEGKIGIETPIVSFDFQSLLKSLEGSVQTTSEPPVNEQTCLQFKSAPSCSFVPEEYRELCERCKAKGY